MRADELRNLLDDDDPDIGAVDDDGWSPLHWAVDAGAGYRRADGD